MIDEQAPGPDSGEVETEAPTVAEILETVRKAGDGATDPKAASLARQNRASEVDIVSAVAAIANGSPDRQRLELGLREHGVTAKALEASLSWYRRQKAGGLDWERRIVRKDDGKPEPIAANAITILRNDPAWASVLAWDDFAQGIVFRSPAPWFDDDRPASDEGLLDDYSMPALTAWLARRHKLYISDETTFKAARTVARGMGRRFDSLRDWLTGLCYVPASTSYVGGPGVGPSWLTRYLGVPDSPYVRFVGRAWLVSGVARGVASGCQVDHVLIAEGAQEIGKSSAFRILAGERFSDSPLPLHDKDRFVNLRAVHVQSFDELAGLGKADQNAVKNYLTARVDIFRPPYGRDPVKVPRRQVFCGTVNPRPGMGYLKDDTGARRFWPVRCGVAAPMDLAGLARDREQIWAEAVAMFDGGVLWHPSTIEERALCRDEQEERQERDVWEEPVRCYLDSIGRFARDDGGDEWTTGKPRAPLQFAPVETILEYAVRVLPRDQEQKQQNRIASIMAGLGWTHERRMIEGERAWRYHRPPPATLEGRMRTQQAEAARLRAEADGCEMRAAKLAIELDAHGAASSPD